MNAGLVKMIAAYVDRADEATEGVKEAIAATRAHIAAGVGDGRVIANLGKAAQALSVTSGIMVDKAHKLAGEPTLLEPPRTATAEGLQRDMRALYRQLNITDEDLALEAEVRQEIRARRVADIPRRITTSTATELPTPRRAAPRPTRALPAPTRAERARAIAESPAIGFPMAEHVGTEVLTDLGWQRID